MTSSPLNPTGTEALVRYGFLGYAEVDVVLSLLFLAVATFALFAVNWRLFNRGYKLRA